LSKYYPKEVAKLNLRGTVLFALCVNISNICCLN